MTEAELTSKLKRLVVRKCNALASIMKVLQIHQDSDQPVLNYITQLKAAARQCNFIMQCTCTTTVKCKCIDFTDPMVLYMLVAGVNDMELQEELLTEADLTLELAEKKAIAKESAKYSQEDISRLNSTYKSNRNEAVEGPCSYCGWTKKHADRKKSCHAWTAKCSCGMPHHYQHLCRRKGVPPHQEELAQQSHQ